MALGFTRFSIGFAKKIMLADPMGIMADAAFSAGTGSLSVASAWAGAIAFAFQIYFLFSGVSDMLIGLARIFNFSLAENFDSPYRSSSVTEFWHRWNLSLASMFRGGTTSSSQRQACESLMMTACIGCFWLSVQWTILIWAVLQMSLMMLERALGKGTLPDGPRHPFRTALTFFVLLFSWVLFRAGNLDAAIEYFRVMLGQAECKATASLLEAEMMRAYNLVLLLVCAITVWLIPNTQRILHEYRPAKLALGVGCFLIAACFMSIRVQVFENQFTVHLRRTLQGWLTGIAGEGNNVVFVGYNGWLFSDVDMRALTGRGPLQTEPQSAFKKSETTTPQAVIAHFSRQLQERGVKLLLVPVPLKPSLYPECVSGKGDYAWIAHPDQAKLYQMLREAGVDVLDLTADMAALRTQKKFIYQRVPEKRDRAVEAAEEARMKKTQEAFLMQDSHWTSEAAKLAAEKVAAHVKEKYPQAMQQNFRDFRIVDGLHQNSEGNLASLLGAEIFDEEDAFLRVVSDNTQSRDSTIALLGDSFVNIYDDPGLGFALEEKPSQRLNAGFAQHLSFALKQPLDVIAINGQGSTGVRRELALRPDDEVRAKKLVVWVISARDLLLSKTAAHQAGVEWGAVIFNSKHD